MTIHNGVLRHSLSKMKKSRVASGGAFASTIHYGAIGARSKEVKDRIGIRNRQGKCHSFRFCMVILYILHSSTNLNVVPYIFQKSSTRFRFLDLLSPSFAARWTPLSRRENWYWVHVISLAHGVKMGVQRNIFVRQICQVLQYFFFWILHHKLHF